MRKENIKLLAELSKFCESEVHRSEEKLQITSNDLFNTEEKVHEVWYSPTGFGSKDDAESIGFVRLPYIVALNEIDSRKYKLSVLSTSITEQFSKNWKLVLEVPQVSVEHQKEFFPHLFIK